MIRWNQPFELFPNTGFRRRAALARVLGAPARVWLGIEPGFVVPESCRDHEPVARDQLSDLKRLATQVEGGYRLSGNVQFPRDLPYWHIRKGGRDVHRERRPVAMLRAATPDRVAVLLGKCGLSLHGASAAIVDVLAARC